MPPVAADAHIADGQATVHICDPACEQCHQLLRVEASWSPVSLRGGSDRGTMEGVRVTGRGGKHRRRRIGGGGK